MRMGSLPGLLGVTPLVLLATLACQSVGCAADAAGLPISGPFNRPPTCTTFPESVPINTNTRFVFCPSTVQAGYEARRDIEARDSGGIWRYKATSTIYLDCQTLAQCQGIGPLTRRRACQVDAC
jgi:hypothetical protein